ncbi:ATP synthase subunit s, mitochondrial-like [Haliotis rufescens]|uniref:ATP synthase subunit s, mitochondrial-like n=1 Tax=Haliotis rufescens TaxID=6454 RepID=UPI00201F5609|nr:ATP synthase subunit s, mitochondrial-like [Haliotis rufescens]
MIEVSTHPQMALLHNIVKESCRSLSVKLAGASGTTVPSRCLWGWLNSVFNRVDEDRLKLVGPDRACAEWMLRCGGRVKWVGLNHWEKDYNTLPASGFDKYKVEEIDGTKSAVMSLGFPHLSGLTHVNKIVLHDCRYLDDDALNYLPLVKDTLQHLQISSCGDITDRGLSPLSELVNLRKLILYDLPEVRNKSAVLERLKSSLSKCEIDYNEEVQKKS